MKRRYNISIISFFLILITTFSCQKELSTSPLREGIPNGKIFIDSNPPGFFIYLNGRNTGQLTPDTVNWLDIKNYTVSLKQSFWRDTSFTLRPDSSETPTKFIDQLNNPKMYGGINFTSEPSGSNVYLNDSLLIPKTDFTLNKILPGYYRVRYAHVDHRESEGVFAVKSGLVASAYLELQDTSVWVDYNISNSPIKNNYLKTVSVDANNIKWIGTIDKGIISYNDKEYKYFNSSNSELPSDRINRIIIDNKNAKWICTEKGLAVLDDNHWTIYSSQNSQLPVNWIETVKFGEDGTVWIGTSNGLVKFSDNIMQVYQYPQFNVNSFDPTWIKSIEFGNENDLWVGTTNYSFYSFNLSSFYTTEFDEKTHFRNYVTELKGIPMNRIIGINRYNQNELIITYNIETIGTQTYFGGISRLNLVDTTFSNYQFGVPPINFNAVYVDKDLKWWIASTKGLISINNFNSNFRYTAGNSKLPFENLTDIAQDKNGFLWCTSQGGGLIKFKGNR